MENTEAAFEAEERLIANRYSKNDAGERAVEVATGGINISNEDHETSPLLGNNGDDKDDRAKELAALPWYKRPSMYWILPPYFLVTMAFGAIVPPKTTLYLELTCRDYYTGLANADPSLSFIPIVYGGGNDQCRTKEIQAQVTKLTLAILIISGLISAFVSPHLGILSDKYGRRGILVLCMVGTVCNEIISIIAASTPETFPVWGFLVGSALDGLSGSFTVAIAIANSYAADCTPPMKRNVAFARFHGALFTGLALGPILGGLLVKATGKIVICFYLLLGVHCFFALFMLVVPESLSKKKQIAARDRHAATKKTGLQLLNTLSGLKIFWPTGLGTSAALRWNLILLAAVDTIAFGVAMGTINFLLTYTYYMFGWENFEFSVYMSAVNGSRVLVLFIGVPLLTSVFKKYRSSNRSSGSDLFDLSTIRVAMFFDTLGFVGYIFARVGSAFTASGIVASLGGMGSATLQAAMTKHVSDDRTGELLGAIGMLHALAKVVGPIVFSTIYIKTVGLYPQTVFVCLAATFGLAFLASWFIRPHVHWDDIAAEQRVADEEERRQTTTPEVS